MTEFSKPERFGKAMFATIYYNEEGLMRQSNLGGSAWSVTGSETKRKTNGYNTVVF